MPSHNIFIREVTVFLVHTSILTSIQMANRVNKSFMVAIFLLHLHIVLPALENIYDVRLCVWMFIECGKIHTSWKQNNVWATLFFCCYCHYYYYYCCCFFVSPFSPHICCICQYEEKRNENTQETCQFLNKFLLFCWFRTWSSVQACVCVFPMRCQCCVYTAIVNKPLCIAYDEYKFYNFRWFILFS